MTPLLVRRPSTDRSFERLYQRHAADVYRYSLGLLGNFADAEDVTQTTFLNAYRAFQRGERPRSPRPWLIAIAHNVCRQRFRQGARRPVEVALNEEGAEAIPEPEGPTAEDLRRALAQLAFNQRAALVMRELEGRSCAEIGAVLELSTEAVEALLFRARRALREQLEGGLTCQETEFALTRSADGRLERADRARLRAHLRECAECARLARSQRAQRSAWKALALVPFPASLSSFFGSSGAAAAATLSGGGVAIGTGIAAKAATVAIAAAVAGSVGYAGVKQATSEPKEPKRAGAAAVNTEPAEAGSVELEVAIDHVESVRAKDEPRATPHPPQRAGKGTKAAGLGQAVPPASVPRAAKAPEKQRPARDKGKGRGAEKIPPAGESGPVTAGQENAGSKQRATKHAPAVPKGRKTDPCALVGKIARLAQEQVPSPVDSPRQGAGLACARSLRGQTAGPPSAPR